LVRVVEEEPVVSVLNRHMRALWFLPSRGDLEESMQYLLPVEHLVGRIHGDTNEVVPQMLSWRLDAL